MNDNDPAIDLALARRDPSKVFSSPMDIVQSDELSRPQKFELLGIWEADAKQLIRAEGEGMDGGENAQIKPVTEALAALEKGD